MAWLLAEQGRGSLSGSVFGLNGLAQVGVGVRHEEKGGPGHRGVPTQWHLLRDRLQGPESPRGMNERLRRKSLSLCTLSLGTRAPREGI